MEKKKNPKINTKEISTFRRLREKYTKKKYQYPNRECARRRKISKN
jgi:hypothetical protein